MNKLSELRAMVEQYRLKIIGIAETCCSDSIYDSELHLEGFNLFRNDRSSGMGGGVMLYVHSSLQAIPCDSLSESGFENSLWYSIMLSSEERLLVGVVYRSPFSSPVNNQKLLSTLSKLYDSVNFTHLLIMGDFNFPIINWDELSCSGGESSVASSFLDAVQDTFLIQHVTDFTRFRHGQQPSLLDLIFTSDPNAIDGVTHLPPLGSSDHVCLFWHLKCFDKLPPTKQDIPMYNYRKGDYDSMNEYFNNIQWSEVLSSSCIQDNWSVFKEIVQEAMGKYIPKSIPKPSKATPPWWSKCLTKAIKAKKYLLKRYSRSKSNYDYAQYAAQRNLVKSKVRYAQISYEKSLLRKLQSNLKAFYSYVKSKLVL